MDKHTHQILINQAIKQSFSGQIIFIENHHKTVEFFQGYANKEKNSLVHLSSVFAIASGTKFLTALAIGKLIDQNKLSLDSYAKDILDLCIKTYDGTIQIKHLLSHTSGLPDYLDESFETEEAYDKIDNTSLLKTTDYLKYFPQESNEFKPGTKFKYNNSAYVYLALIIEKITGMTYQDYVNKEILQPFEITRGGVFSTDALHDDCVVGYIDKNYEKTNFEAIPVVSGGDGGAYMNAYDFKTIIDAFINGDIISKELARIFMKPQIQVNEEKNIYYGLGLWLKKINNSIIPYLEGNDPGISFKCVFNPSQSSFYWIVSNTEHGVWNCVDAFDNAAFK